MTTITKSTARTIREEMNAALAEVAARHGLTIKPSTTRYTEGEVRFTVTAVDASVPVTIPDYVLRSYGLDPTVEPGLAFHYNGKLFTFNGVNTRRPRYPISATTPDGKQFKLPESAVAAINAATKGN